MKSSDIEIMKVFLCTLDESLPYPNYNEVKLDTEDSLYGYIQKLCSAALTDTAAKIATYDADAYLAGIVTDEPNGLEAFVSVTADTVYDLVKANAEMHSGSGIFAFIVADEQVYVAFFKMPFMEMYNCRLDAEGQVSWALNTKIMPKPSLKSSEYFIIDVCNRIVRMSDSQYYVDDCHVNYLAECVLQLKPKPSEKETVETIAETTVEVIRECYPEEKVPEKIMDYRKEIANHVEETGRVSVARIEEAVFRDNEAAGAKYRERLQEERIQREPIAVSKKTERALTRKQKIITDNGIELMVPVEYLKNSNYIEYVQDENGNITILLKDIHAIDA